MILTAMFFHVCWVVVLYITLTILRSPNIWGLDTRSGTIAKYAELEPRVSANLSNQFEWPMLFYAVCILLVSSGVIDHLQVGLAWIFVIGRVVHSLVQIFTSNIRLRGIIFSINFLAVFFMWFRLVVTS